MKVVITNLRNENTCWYNVGDIYDVEPYCKDGEYDDKFYMIKGWNNKWNMERPISSNLGNKYWIFVKDCMIIDEILLDEDLFKL